MKRKLAIFCDFDGTITEKDNIIAMMKQFAPPEWEAIKDDILAENVSIREGVGKLYSLLPSDLKQDLIQFAVNSVKIRPGFREFIEFVRSEHIPLYVVSGGIDFFVEPILEGFGPFAGLYCNQSDFSQEFIKILWPNKCDPDCENDCGCCKPSIIRSVDQNEDLFKIVIGDSVTDFQASKQADFVLARDFLLEKAEEFSLPHAPFTTFFDVIDELRKLIESRSKKVEKRWNELADVKDELAARDWFRGTSGNLAIKVSDEPLQFLVTASGRDKRKRTSDDFLLVNGEGQPIESTRLRPSAETLLHVEIYNRSNAGCSLHVHTVNNNVISELYGDAGEITFRGQELIKAFDLWEEDAELVVPIIPNHADIPTLAKVFSQYVKTDKGAVLIRNHGITVWGRDAFEAKKLLEAAEFLFSYHLKLLAYKNILR